MGKVKKILFYIFSAVILTVIIVPVAVSLLLDVPAAQNYVARVAMKQLSAMLGTRVTLDYINVRPFNKVVIDGLYVEDHQADTLLHVNHLSVGIVQLPIMGNHTILGSVELDRVGFFLTHDSTGASNLTRVLAPLKSDKPKEKKKIFRLAASSVAIKDMRFRMQKYEIIEKNGVNFTDIEVDNFNLAAQSLTVVGDSISVAIDNISLHDKSGLAVDKLSARNFKISGSGMLFDRLNIAMPESRLQMDHLRMHYDSWAAYKNFLNEVRLEAVATRSKVSFSTIGYFAPRLRDWKLTLSNVDLNVSGPISDMRGRVSRAETRDTKVDVKFRLDGIPDIPNTRFTLDVGQLQTNASDIEYIVGDITGKSLGDAKELVDKLGEIDLKGNFDGLLSDFLADADLSTSQGDVKLNLGIMPTAAHSNNFKGYVEMTRFDVGELTGAPKLGRASLKAKVDGNVTGNIFVINTDAELSQLQYNGYNYNSIAMKGLIDNRTFRGSIGCEDPNIEFDFNGMLDFTDSIPSYDFDMALRQADLRKLNFNRRDSVSVLSCRLVAHAKGNTLDNLNGELVVSDLLYVNHVDSVRTGRIRLVGENSERSKMLSMSSSFADVEFRGRLSYSKLFGYVANTVSSYMPLLSARRAVRHEAIEAVPGDVNNYSIVRLSVKEANNVAGIFMPGLQLAEGTNLLFMFNPAAEQLSLSLKSDYIERGNFFVSNLDVNSRNQGDSLSLYVRAGDFYSGNFYMPNLSIIGGAKNNRFNVSTRFSDPEKGTRALIGIASSLGKDPETGMPQVTVRLTPSSYNIGEKVWRITSRNIVYDSTKLAVNNFLISSEGQYLMVDGVASHSAADTLKVRLTNFNLTPITQVTSRAGYHVEGHTTGYANFVSALSDGVIYANMVFDSVKVNSIPIPSARFESEWDLHMARAGFTMTELESRDTVMTGYFRPTDKRIRVDASLKGINMGLLDPLLTDVVKNTGGTGDAVVRLTGTTKQPQLNGTVQVRDLKTTVDFTNATYTIPAAEVKITNNEFTLKPASLFDEEGNGGTLEMTLGNTYFKNFTYDIRVTPKNMLVLNTNMHYNDYFYGKVYGSGAAHIKGDRLGTSMNIVATTDDNSAFFMPLSDKTDMSEADFVVFESPNAVRLDTTNVLVRKRMMYERANKKRSVTRSNLDINMTINVRPNTDFQLVIDPTVGDIIRGRGAGTLNLQIKPREDLFTMYGDVVIEQGSYLFTLQNIINKKFTIDPGSTIKWTGEPLDAMLDISAYYKTNASLAPLATLVSSNAESESSMYDKFQRTVPVDCIIKLGDRLSQPSIEFDVNVQNVTPEVRMLLSNMFNTQEMKATQFIWLLAVNSFYVDNTGTNMNFGAMGGSATGFDFLSNQLSNWLSSDKYNIGLRYRPKSEITSDEVDIGFSTDLLSRRLQLEVEGNYDFGNTANQKNNGTSNLTGNFALTWLIDRTGNLKARVFTRTIDRFDENQGLQESGLGIYYKEDFNSFKDILRNLRSRFKKKEAVSVPDSTMQNINRSIIEQQ